MLTTIRNSFLLIFMVMCSGLAMAQPVQDPPVETLTYDVSDLLRPRGNYPIPESLDTQSGRGQTQRSPQTRPANESPVNLDTLIQLLEDTIDRDSWRDNGGNTGAIRPLGTVLVIAQTHSNHQAIAKLLSTLSNNPSTTTMLCIRAYWVMLEPAEATAVFTATKVRPNSNILEMPEVSEKLIDENHLYWTGQTTCFNGQTVHVSSGRESNYVKDVTPIVGTQAIGYDPTMGVARNGVQLQVTPQILPSGDASVLDLHSSVMESSVPVPIPVPQNARASALAQDTPTIERMNIVSHELHTTVRLPLRKKILVGGMRMNAVEKDGPVHTIYLVVEVDAMR